MKITRFAIAAAAILLGATSALAQNRAPIPQGEMSKYVVSAKAGVVNVVEGEASVTRVRPFATADMLISGDELLTGDTVKTGARGRLEVLLNPGSYLRVSNESEFVFLFDTLGTNKIKLLRGSAVIEASAMEDLILVETPRAQFELAQVGLYRFNVAVDGKSDIAVRKGRVLVGKTTIKPGKRVVVEGNTAATIAKLSKQDVDSLDDWSKGRAKALIAANRSLSVTPTLGMAFMRNAWIYDPFCRCYTFFPMGGGFTSPYGGDYSVCNPYWSYYRYPRYNNGEWSGGGSSGTGQPTSGGGSVPGGGGTTGGGGGNHQPPSLGPTNPPSRSMGGEANSSERERPASGPRRP